MQASVETVIGRVMEAYALMYDDQSADAVREEIAAFIEWMFHHGETDEARLAVSALARFRKTDTDIARG